ncbi:flagellar filament capping protein FliD [Thalassospiraceae bacterium SW-3-3]|nr:flagellar filament capping protein FliD [Thalassospiraceae bacterium SW-3-3]
MSGVNLNNIYVGENGKIQLSGASSNIDFVDVVDKMIAARRLPAVSLESRIESNDEKLSSLRELSTLTGTLKDAMSKLYGATSFDNSKNIFEAKQVFTSSSNGSGTASSASQLIGITATNAAPAGTYTIEVNQIASKHKIATNTIAANPTDDAPMGAGTFNISSATGNADISVGATDSLADIRDKINAVTSTTGVKASVVKVADGQSTIVFTSTKEGEDNRMTLTDVSGTVLADMGANEIDPGNNAEFEFDGISITRQSNEIGDLVDGLNISLYDAEPGTTVTLEVEQDLNQAKTAILNFVDAFNALQSFINEKTYVDPATGEASEDAILLGNSTVKRIESSLQQIAGTFAMGVTDRTNEDDYSVLAEIGIDFIPFGTASDPLLNKTLEIDEAKLNDALLNQPNEVMELFAFRSKTDNANLTMTGFTGSTQAAQYDFTIDASGGTINGVTYDVTVNGVTTTETATVSGNSITTVDGLRLFYGGDGTATETATVNTSVGIGTQMYFELNKILDVANGSLTQEIASIEEQNTVHQEKIDRIDERLVSQRETLMNQFIAMETALARMKNIQSSLDELMAAGKNDS